MSYDQLSISSILYPCSDIPCNIAPRPLSVSSAPSYDYHEGTSSSTFIIPEFVDMMFGHRLELRRTYGLRTSDRFEDRKFVLEHIAIANLRIPQTGFMEALRDLGIDIYSTPVVNARVGASGVLIHNATRQRHTPSDCCFLCKATFTRKQSLLGV
jgi:hypothetical protein